MKYENSGEWQELMHAVAVATKAGNEFYARRIMQRVRSKELSTDRAIHLLQSDSLRVRNSRIGVFI